MRNIFNYAIHSTIGSISRSFVKEGWYSHLQKQLSLKVVSNF